MYDNDVEFQSILFLAYGILIGGISNSLFFILVFIVLYEFYVFHISRMFPPNVKNLDRVLLNVMFIFGWIIGRILMLNETGIEDIIDYFN